MSLWTELGMANSQLLLCLGAGHFTKVRSFNLLPRTHEPGYQHLQNQLEERRIPYRFSVSPPVCSPLHLHLTEVPSRLWCLNLRASVTWLAALCLCHCSLCLVTCPAAFNIQIFFFFFATSSSLFLSYYPFIVILILVVFQEGAEGYVCICHLTESAHSSFSRK